MIVPKGLVFWAYVQAISDKCKFWYRQISLWWLIRSYLRTGIEECSASCMI